MGFTMDLPPDSGLLSIGSVLSKFIQYFSSRRIYARFVASRGRVKPPQVTVSFVVEQR